MPRVEDVTEVAIRDSSSGPGETIARVVRAKGSKTITPGMQSVLDRLNHQSDNTVGGWARVLAYAMPWNHATKTDHTNFVRLVKGGHVRLCRVHGKAPAHSNAGKPGGGGENSYYIMRAGACPTEVDDNTLRGRKRKRRTKRR